MRALLADPADPQASASTDPAPSPGYQGGRVMGLFGAPKKRKNHPTSKPQAKGNKKKRGRFSGKGKR